MRVVKNIKGFVTYDEIEKCYSVYQKYVNKPILITHLEDGEGLASNDYMETTGSNEIKYVKLNKGYFIVYGGRLRFYGNIQLLMD